MASQFKPIADAVATAVAAVTGAPTTVVRKRDVVKPRDTLPICVVSYGADADAGWATCGDGATDKGTIGKAYSVVIAVYRSNLADVADSATNPDLIEAIKQALNVGTLSGVSTVWSTALETHDEWEAQPFGESAEVSRFVLHFGAAESRVG